MTQQTCQYCDGDPLTDGERPADFLEHIGSHQEASTVDGGFSADEFMCSKCGKHLLHTHGVGSEGWTFLENTEK